MGGGRASMADGLSAALVTLGGYGALFVPASDETKVAAPSITVVDTIGAGDAFGGGFLTHWARSGLGTGALADPEAGRAGAQVARGVGAPTGARAGASPPRLAEVTADL